MYQQKQYNLVLESRNILFDYCRTIREEDFINQNSSFGRGGSMRNLLVHIANIYEYWIANTTLKMNKIYSQYEDYKNIDDIINLFAAVNGFMNEFLEFEKSSDQIEFERNGIKTTAEPLTIFTHAITHEFHHKGQILSLSRHLGYTPIDTDIIR